MRLSRNHPQLTANDWFERVLFADALGDISGQRRERGPVRGPGELRALILSSLNGRNFEFTGMPAEFHVFNGADEVTSSGPGSRPRPIPLNLAESENQTFQLKLNLKNGDHFKFQFPVSVRIEFLKSPLQGAVHWQGEESSPQTMTINSESEVVNVPLSVSGKCDYVNRPDGSCVDYVHLQVLNQGLNQMGEQPVAKKRFYVRVIPKSIL